MAPSFVQAAISVLFASSVWAVSDSTYGGVVVKRADPVVPTVLPGTWQYQGCYTDPGPRTLSGSMFANTTGMTPKMCIAYCDNLGYIYAGAEYSQECFCGNKIESGGTVAPKTDCNMPCKGNATEACGGPNRLSIFWNGQDPPAGPSHNPGTLGFGLFGCYTEGTTGRALTNVPAITGDLTVAKCIAACKNSGYSMAGVEYAQECYCGNAFSNTPAVAPEGLAGCNLLCKGNSSEYCGAGNRLDVYKLDYQGASSTISSVSSTTTSRSSTLTSATTTATTTRSSTLTSATTTVVSSSSSTQASTTSRSFSSSSTTTTRPISSSPSTTSSVSYSSTTRQISFSSSSLILSPSTTTRPISSSTSSVSSLSSQSSTTTGTTTSSTSAAATLGYKPIVGKYTRQGCYNEIPNSRALTGAAYNDFNAMTLEACAANCAAFTYWGVEYGGECYCGNTLPAASTKQLDGDCNFLCPGNSLEYCGAGLRLELYKLTSQSSSTSSSSVSSTTTTSAGSSSSVSSSVSSSSSSTTTSRASTTTTTSAVPTVTGLPTGWKYGGCYKEGTTGRALTQMQAGGATNTVNNCINSCIAAGYTVAGMEYSEQCFCDNYVSNGAVPTNDETKCSMACSGNPDEKCGAGDILSLYYTGTLKTYQAPVPQTVDLPGSWEYKGCWTDNINDKRGLQWQTILTTNNSATNCLNLCHDYGFMSGGMQYGTECYCGDDSAMLATGSTKVEDTECQILCSGDKNYYCGGNVRNSYYQWTGTPLYVWNKPTGNAMGSYKYLIGGVVVPLITTTGVNDKIVFMEKSGTGAPNTTGTYELDLAFLDDPTKAWRELHVKTDIFCAAGITLPDKAGRQLNIGGWSGDSTFGVRVYWPDGSPGVPGTNDWAEDNANLRLLEGRWYPSALNLANGSVLVIGGEIGSNSAPTPSLEILPLPAGGYAKYLDWLERTDPNNLYPFLWVLPSGGIFIIYYNEARILDEKTFDTIKTLPNAPGSVNNFLAGRTYPLEGTGVIMPMYPPYTAPVTFMACGGSSEGAAQAIDNCVSVQPEVAEPKWVIERMPSQRVLSCICALPDGTYLILNGAKAGVAGFGLANTPNLQAVLYDPTKDINQRMSIMATTTVARMYHSEAILLPDGRVLVSGSNPEDGKNPEEYRVEVFNPPYTLANLPKPIFSINSKDWVYKDTQNVKITTTVPSGNVGGIRVSMMAAVSSTHGNSMGQRTLFLDVTCGGAPIVCSVVVPPSAHVAPPGWYQIFVLDGPTPGKGIWIRIGGDIADAAGIGNWPNNSLFQKPGLGAVGT